ncbi:hypothetical protein [Methanobrevibacter sp.]|uniref:hypothetical protein n=1 Tax=Methanobrevibacter sp. TaxID=66852 RepID=UPI00386E1B4D
MSHSTVESYNVFANPIIMSSSFSTKVKTYPDIDLKMEINTCRLAEIHNRMIHSKVN